MVNPRTTREGRQPKRRRFQYRLRSLLILMTVICIWLGIIVKRARDQQEAVEFIKENGATVTYDYQFDGTGNGNPNAMPPGPAWLRRIIGDDFFVNVIVVELVAKQGKLIDDDLAFLESLPKTMPWNG